MAKTNNKQRPVLVTTARRLVVFGYLESHDIPAKRIILTNVRNCLYWSKETGGFLGLAADGPAAGSQIGKCAPRVELEEVTSVSDVSESAVQQWESFQ